MFDAISIASTAGASGGVAWAFIQFAPLLLIFVVFYFLLIRPQQKKLKEHKAMVDALRRLPDQDPPSQKVMPGLLDGFATIRRQTSLWLHSSSGERPRIAVTAE